LLVAQTAGPSNVVGAVAKPMANVLIPGPPADPEPEPEAGTAALARLQPRRAAPRPLSVASSQRLRVRAVERELHMERMRTRHLRSAAKSSEATKELLDRMEQAKLCIVSHAHEAAAAAEEARRHLIKLGRELGRAERRAAVENATRENPLAHAGVQAANTEDLLAAEQTEVVALRARASDAEAAKSHALKAQRVDDRQRAAAVTTACERCATTEQPSPPMPRCQLLVRAKQKLSELQLFIKLTSRAETASRRRKVGSRSSAPRPRC
jgi:hypothetical protein